MRMLLLNHSYELFDEPDVLFLMRPDSASNLFDQHIVTVNRAVHFFRVDCA